MPSSRCSNPVCENYVPERGLCTSCESAGKKEKTRHSYYDQHLRNPEAKRFYDSKEWQRARAVKLTQTPWCERCSGVAETVHHVVPVRDATPEQRVNQVLLMSLCKSCHNAIEAEIKAKCPVNFPF